MEYVYAIMQLLAGLGAFLIGFNILSDNLEKLANTRLRKMFSRTSKNPIIGVTVGTVATALVQSSSAITVMIVGFVNAGIMDLAQATALIMGANIGTTFMAQIVALNEFSFINFAIALTFVGVVMEMVFKKDRVKSVGRLLGGLGLVFMGLRFMSGAMTIFSEDAVFQRILGSVTDPFALLMIGILVTAIIQSSSALTSIMVVMAGSGLVIGGGGNAVFYVILGTNIGTCLTAMVSAIPANTNGKRAAMIHLLYNVFGSVIVFFMLLFWRGFADNVFAKWFPLPATQIAMFHTFFNVISAVIFLPFINVFVYISKKIFKDKENGATKRKTFLDARFLVTPSVALAQVAKELEMMCAAAVASLEKALDGFVKQDRSREGQIKADSRTVAEMNRDIIDYLIKISSNNLSFQDEVQVSRYHHIVGDILRVSELAENIARYTVQSVDNGLVFSDEVKTELTQMMDKIKALYEGAMKVFNNAPGAKLGDIDKLEDEVDAFRRKLIDDHIGRLNEGKCKPESSGIFINLVGNLERACDHLNFVAHSGEKKNYPNFWGRRG